MSLNNTKNLLPWSEKYRPESISSIIYHEKITKTIVNYMELNKLPHLLFYGPPGTGKTSCMVAIAKHFYGDDYDNMVMIFNASAERGIETVRKEIKQFATTVGIAENKLTPPFKLIILDEIDAMTDDAQAILRKVVEKYVNNVRFCFICNYLKKINPAIQSRCIIFRFSPIPKIYLQIFINNVCKKENIKIQSNAIDLIIEKTNGDMRKLLNIMQSAYMYVESKDKLITEHDISKILSCPTTLDIQLILTTIQTNNLKFSQNLLYDVINQKGFSLVELITQIYTCLMDRIINNNTTVINYDINKTIEIIKNLCIVYENLTYCNNDYIQTISFISVFYI